MDATELGAKLFEGRTAEVYEMGPDRVLKLYVAGLERGADIEATCYKTIATSGIRIPKLYEVVEYEHRRGLVLERINGPTLFAAAMEEPIRHPEYAAQMADIQASLYKSFPHGALKNRIQCLHQEISSVDMPRATKGRLLERLKRLDTGERLLCHYDFHAGNVLLGPQPVIVDWVEASLGPPICDFARTLLLSGYPDHEGTRSATFVNALLDRVLAHLGVEKEDIDDWVPIVAAARLSEGFTGEDAAKLLSIAERGA